MISLCTELIKSFSHKQDKPAMKNIASKKKKPRTFLAFPLISLFLFSLNSCKEEATPIQPRKMEVLFLGHDSEHHNSEEYMPYLASALAQEGINFSYTSDPADLNKKKLSFYDALVIYANHDEIKPSEERALMDFIKKGGGFIPIHSASYCFRNSDKYVKLVGAQFASHDTATFSLETIIPDHPITNGLESFSAWDETYVHTMHSDKEVLMERVEGDHREPYTWVKNYGKGRVFYTAWGHDLRTWSHQGFHELIRRGILWAIGDEKKAAVEQLLFPALQYAPAKIANYERRDPPPQLQAPLSPEESMKLIQIPPEFKLELFASEPDIINPIAMNWDEKGRLWILETVDYPNEIIIKDGVGNDRIKILEDTDGDGKADKFTVFAENLSVPTSLVFSNGGVIVSQAPYFIFLKDTDGDDKADVRENIIEGWGTFDTHAGPSNLRYGFDNQIWGVLGYSGFEGIVGKEEHHFSQGIYRFRPDGSKLEYMSRTSNNTWGLGFSENFDVFISTANNTHSGYYGIPDQHVREVKGIHMRGVEKIDGHYLFHPITRNFRQVDVFGGFTAAAGHALYTARSFPKAYWNRIALVAEPTGHLLHNAIVEPVGAGFVEKDGWNLLASADEWVSPVAAEVGPDGAVWVLDWYNFIIQHNPTPPGFENGPGNAHINALRDRQRGRIYRIAYLEAPDYQPITLNLDDADQLLSTLSSKNLFWRMHAQRLLVERGETDVKEQLLTNLKDNSKDKMNLNSKVVHSIWTLHGLNLINQDNPQVIGAIEVALRHPAEGVRKAAVQAMPSDDDAYDAIANSNILKDANQQTLLAAINKLWQLPSSEKLANTILSLAKRDDILSDLWLSRATYMVAVKHKDSFIDVLVQDDPDALDESMKEIQAQKIDYKSPSTSTADWNEIPVPKWLSQANIEELSGFTGVIWYRKSVDLSAIEAASKSSLHLAGADNSDITYINGVQVGSGSGWDVARKYEIPRGVLKAGNNSIAIQVQAGLGLGYAFPERYYLQCGDNRIPLAATWKYKIEEVISSGRSEYADGDNIISLFLKNYGPDAIQSIQASTGTETILDNIILIKTIQDQMKYDITEIEAEVGQEIEIVFQNNDAMQHNLMIVKPGTLALVGVTAEEFAKTKEAPERDYIPEMEEILYATPMLDPGQTYRLRVKVPDEPGLYPYVCTFPGHWQTMNGILRVTETVQ